MAWIIYSTIDGTQQGSRKDYIDPSLLEAERGIIECPDSMGDPASYDVDLSTMQLVPIVNE